MNTWPTNIKNDINHHKITYKNGVTSAKEKSKISVNKL